TLMACTKTLVSRCLVFRFAIVGLLFLASTATAQERKTENVILFMTYGLRWQEVFTGAEMALINKADGGVANGKDIEARVWRESHEECGNELLPFCWDNIAKEGQICCNQREESDAHMTNTMKFSYPGYNEILT